MISILITSEEQSTRPTLHPENSRYTLDKVTLLRLKRVQSPVKLLVHNYGALKRNGQWFVHPLGEQALRATALLIRYIQDNNPNCQIKVLLGGSIPYDGRIVSLMYGEYLYELLSKQIPLPQSNLIHVIDRPQTAMQKSAGFSTSGEIEYAQKVFKGSFFSISASPHVARIRQLIQNKNIPAHVISFEGITYHLGEYSEVIPIIRRYRLVFTLYEVFVRVFLQLFDKQGELLEKRAERRRIKRPPPTF